MTEPCNHYWMAIYYPALPSSPSNAELDSRIYARCTMCGATRPEAVNDEVKWWHIHRSCATCGAEFLPKVGGQQYCDDHRYLSGTPIYHSQSIQGSEHGK